MSNSAAEEPQTKFFVLTNSQGTIVKLTNYGAYVTSILTKDKHGQLGNVVLGFDDIQDYFSKSRYFGCVVGRFCNRIAHGRFTLDNVEYELATNNNGNHLHGGIRGFDKQYWTVVDHSEKSVRLSYTSADGEEGYPGELQVQVVYTLTEENELKIEYFAETDKPTVVNLTNHSYFNLSADPLNTTILDHQVTVNADRYTVVDDKLIPTGELRSVESTPLDFTVAHQIGDRIEQVAPGYDHNYVLNKDKDGQLSLAATVHDAKSGRTMTVYTTQPGIQLYTGNFLDASANGFGKYSALCLETQHFPDSPNQPSFPSTTLRPGNQLHEVTIYKFQS